MNEYPTMICGACGKEWNLNDVLDSLDKKSYEHQEWVCSCGAKHTITQVVVIDDTIPTHKKFSTAWQIIREEDKP